MEFELAAERTWGSTPWGLGIVSVSAEFFFLPSIWKNSHGADSRKDGLGIEIDALAS